MTRFLKCGLAMAVAFMAMPALAQIVPVNVGTGANSGNGDSLRVAMQKLNASVSTLDNRVTGCDVKQTLLSGDSNGWIVLDGRAKSTLTTTQQAVATSCGIGANLPDARGRLLLSASVARPVLSANGSSSVTIAQNQLPNASLSVGGSFSGSTGTYNWSGTAAGGAVPSFATQSANQVSASIPVSGSISGSTSSINGGVTQQPLTIEEPNLSVVTKVYLGI